MEERCFRDRDVERGRELLRAELIRGRTVHESVEKGRLK